jgi:DNA-binding transcriptional LysR family regulator
LTILDKSEIERSMNNPLDMFIFAKVVELKSFSNAAKDLGLSRSAISKHVSKLEHRLGARLLSRSTRTLSLTEAGHSAYEHCARIVAEVAASELSVQCFVRGVRGRLRVSVPGAFGRMFFVPLLPDYLRLHPDVSIELTLSDQLANLVEGRFDIAISSSPLSHANLIRRQLTPLRYVLCASADYLRVAGMPKHPQDLKNHNCIFYSSAAVRGDLWILKRGRESQTIEVSGNLRVNNSESVRDAALGGLGIALMPTFVSANEIKSGALIPVLGDWTPQGTLGSGMTAYFISDRQLTPKIRTLIDYLVSRFKRNPAWDR